MKPGDPLSDLLILAYLVVKVSGKLLQLDTKGSYPSKLNVVALHRVTSEGPDEGKHHWSRIAKRSHKHQLSNNKDQSLNLYFLLAV